MMNSSGQKQVLIAILTFLMAVGGCSAMMDVDDGSRATSSEVSCKKQGVRTYWYQHDFVRGQLSDAMTERCDDAASDLPCTRTLARIRRLKGGLTVVLHKIDALRADVRRFKDAGRCQPKDFRKLRGLDALPVFGESYSFVLRYEPGNQATAERFAFALSYARAELEEAEQYFDRAIEDVMEKHYFADQAEEDGNEAEPPLAEDERCIALLTDALQEQRTDDDSCRISSNLSRRIDDLVSQVRALLCSEDQQFEAVLSRRPENRATAVRFEAALSAVCDDLRRRSEVERAQQWQREKAEWDAFFAAWPNESTEERYDESDVDDEPMPTAKGLNRKVYKKRAAH